MATVFHIDQPERVDSLLPCDYCKRSTAVEALKAVPRPDRRALLACPLCAARLSLGEAIVDDET